MSDDKLKFGLHTEDIIAFKCVNFLNLMFSSFEDIKCQTRPIYLCPPGIYSQEEFKDKVVIEYKLFLMVYMDTWGSQLTFSTPGVCLDWLHARLF